MRRFLFGIGAMALLAAAAVAGLLVLARQPEMAEVATPAPSSFDRGVVTRGAQLALIGNCNTCHTAPEGKTFAGGRALPTPFGTIHATNITPDPDTGIGRWSEEAFRRSLREGVRRDGAHLYPAFPYDHFTKVTDEDIAALYAYLMTREPVRAAAPANDLVFPLNVRATVAGWKLLFLQPGAYRPDPSRDAAWNRGKYLTDGLAHCGACHTPRNVLGAEKQDRYLAGGDAEGWHAPALNAQSPAPVPWDADSLFAYLRDGFPSGARAPRTCWRN
jgi:mono/diheme cytochrome c family protein